MLWLVDFSRGSGRAGKFSAEQKATATGAPAACSGVWSRAVSQRVSCSVLSPGQLRSGFLLGFPLAVQTCCRSKQRSGLLFSPGSQEPMGSASAPRCRPGPKGSHGPLQPPDCSGAMQMRHLCPAGSRRPALLAAFTAVPTPKSPAGPRNISNALLKPGREQRD